MRLLHYELLPYISERTLINQWGELNTIISKHPDNIMINYAYDNKLDLLHYAGLVLNQMLVRHIEVYSYKNILDYYIENFIGDNLGDYNDADDIVADLILESLDSIKDGKVLFVHQHTNLYLLQCFFNIQEKYFRGAPDLTEESMNALEGFVMLRFKNTYISSVVVTPKY